MDEPKVFASYIYSGHTGAAVFSSGFFYSNVPTDEESLEELSREIGEHIGSEYPPCILFYRSV